MARRRADRGRLEALRQVAQRASGWRPAREVLTPVRAVPTIFAQLDVATRVGGLPLQRMVLVHGPSNHGKTTLAHGLGLSFLQRDHVYGFVDAEFTTPEDWLAKLMRTYVAHPGFIAKRPQDYEEVRGDVRVLLDLVRDQQQGGQDDLAALIAIDSVRKLVPRDLFNKVTKGKDGLDGASGRGGQIKAGAHAAWLDELIPLLDRSNATALFIAREAQNPERSSRFDPDYKVTGGKALIFDASLQLRVERAGWVKRGKDPGEIVGERHRVTVLKTKVGGKDGRATKFYFHTSNGVLIPEGFDPARDVVEMALQCGRFARRGGGWIDDQDSGESWRGEHEAVQVLTDAPAQLQQLRADVVQRCSPVEIEEESQH